MAFRRQLRAATALATLFCVPLASLAARPVRHSTWDEAVARRETFQAQPTHTRAEFMRVEQGFRAVYFADPADPHAAEAVNAEAALLAEQGRELKDAASSRAALRQYEFLRTQYPGSPLRGPALLAEARIYAESLNNSAAARERYRLLMKEAPGSTSARTARLELANLDAAARPHRELAPEKHVEILPANSREIPVQTNPKPASADPEQAPVTGGALVTGIRHWSTSSYTRVAIDLGGEVTFEAARVAHPDRLYFDLHGARLAPELVGKSFDVTDNGFLRTIRAAQEPGGVTRVVLDVSDVTEYSAFLLPNPERLIIDIHGGKLLSKRGQETASVAPQTVQPPNRQPDEQMEVPVAPAAGRRASAAANRSGLPAMAPTDGGELVRPIAPQSALASTSPAPRTGVIAHPTAARPVPNSVANKAPESTSELAAVSEQPGRMEATRQPTTKPVAAVVRGLGKPASQAPVPEATTTDVPPTVPVNLGRRTKKPDASDPAGSAPTRAAERTADGQTSLVRALGLRIGRIVIDAGHGGHDSGTLGVDGLQEKDVVLDVALRLGRLLHERLGAEIIYTRSDDTFIPLETRTAIANKAQADLFLSIHANSSPDASARGVETYYLNFTSDANALDVAARENAAGGQSVHQLSDLVKKIALKDKIAESREFAADVEGSLYAGLEKGNDGLKNRGVKKAPFVVLIGANMPSILAEISFVTNARDAGQLRQPEYRERVAESLFAGVAKYENGLAGGKAPGLRASSR